MFKSLCGLALSLGFLVGIEAKAATPSTGTLTDTSGPVTYTAGPFSVANPTPVPLVDSGPECNGPLQPCDDFLLTVALPADYADTHPDDLIQVKLNWTDTGTGASDYDLYVYPGTVTATDGSQQALSQSASSANPETTTMRVFNGTRQFTVKVVPYTPTGETVSVELSLVAGAPGSGGGITGFGQATPTSPGVPRYQNFYPPPGSTANGSAGEFNIGFNPHTGNILTLSDLDTFRVTPPERLSPPLPEAGPALWTPVSPSLVGLTTLDPILFTDPLTGRTLESMQTTGAEALFGYSDDDGATWTQASVAPPNGGADHQTVAAGPYPASFPLSNPVYPNAVYYCSQDVVGPASCQRSDTGGATFGPGIPIYEGNGITACGGLHGHAKVGPDGAVYVPVPQCGDQQGGVVSLDAGLTWQQYLIPGSQSFAGGSTDPSVAIDASNTLYQCYVNGQGAEHHVHVAVSHDHGATWSNDRDLGLPVGVINAVFPEAVAGSAGRAACGFLGTNVAGDHESLDFPGNWYLFIATTYDGGNTWTTVNATPGDPVQGAGGIWNGGGGNLNRNLLDFNEVTMDDRGRVLFGYDDGCVSERCLQSGGAQNDFVAYQRVARQTGGRTLLAAFDAPEPALPKAPYLEGTRTQAGVATVGGDKAAYQDASVDPAVTTYFYEVSAVNAEGEGPRSNEAALEVTAVVAEDACQAPGLTLLTDAANDSLTSTPGTDLRSFALSQPFSADGSLRLRFELDTDPGQLPQPPGSSWYVSFKAPDGQIRGVRMAFPADESSLTAPTFESYLASPNSSGVTDGRFVQSGSEKPADPASTYDAASGRIVIVVPASDLGVQAGSLLSGFNAASLQAVETPAAGLAESVDEMPDGLAYQGSFTVRDNATCAPNSPPLAVMSTSTTAGTAPLAVTFDAGGSTDPDPGDAVSQYTFDFGDGSPAVTQSGSTVTHTYQSVGVFKASLTVTDSRGLASQNAAEAEIEVEAAFEDGDPHLAYGHGWHTVKDGEASGGTFHLAQGNGEGHGLGFSFDLGSSRGTLEYLFATSTEGGSADLYVDGVFARTVHYAGSSGSLRHPVLGASATVEINGQGSHTIELRNVSGPAFVDRFSIAGASPTSQPPEEPGPTTLQDRLLDVGQQLLTELNVTSKAESVTVIAEAAVAGVPYKLSLLDPDGLEVGEADASPKGIAKLELPVRTPGVYVVRATSLGLVPIQLWSAATPRLKR